MSFIKATILIPTYNRSAYLARLLRFLVYNFDFERIKIIVLDGSDKEASANKEACTETGVEYRYYGPGIPMLERWLDGIKCAETEFVSFLADDDRLQPYGYYACLDFLDSHPEYSIAHGNYIWLLEQGEGEKRYQGYQTFSIEHESPLERLFAFLSDYVPITYGVYRTSILKTAYEETISSLSGIDANDLHFTELLSGCIPVVMGKVKKLDSSYYDKSVVVLSPQDLTIYPKLVFAEDFSSRYGKIKATLKKILSLKYNSEIIDDAIDYCFGAYYGKVLSRNVVTRHFMHLMKDGVTPKLTRGSQD